MSKVTLYEVAAQYRALLDQLVENGADEQTTLDTLEAEGYPLQEKAQNIAFYIRNLEATADSIDEAIKQMQQRKKAMENHAANLRRYLHVGMSNAGVSKIESPYFNIAIRQNPGKVEIFDEAQLPMEWFAPPPEPPLPAPDKKRIMDALKAGKDVPGCRIVKDTRLEIK